MRRLAIAAVLGASALAFAQPTSDPMADAEALAKQGDFVGAAGKFKLAYARDPKPSTICNVGVAYYKAKQLARAQLFLNRCLERGTALQQTFVDQVRAVLTSIEQTLRAGDFTPIDITVEPGGASVSVVEYGDDESFIGARVLWLPFGPHKLTARLDGYVEQTVDVAATGHDVKPVKITLVKVPPTTPEVGSGSATSAGSGSAEGSGSAATTNEGSDTTPPIVETSRRSPMPAIAATSVAALGVAMAIVGYKKAQDRADYSLFAVSFDVFERDKDAIRTWNIVFATGIGVGIVGSAAAGYLWARYARSPSHVEVEPAPGGGVVTSLSGRW
ncbi:MAG TPA: hypothetical protein VL326_19565 [Kofleriaceae bacterium]|nr:hypothetical protein [Kofleriaceae bacterium]